MIAKEKERKRKKESILLVEVRTIVIHTAPLGERFCICIYKLNHAVNKTKKKQKKEKVGKMGKKNKTGA